jgi:hypothetical protein
MTDATAVVVKWVTTDQPVRDFLRAILDDREGFRGRRAGYAWGNSPSMQGISMHVAAMGDFVEHLLRWDDGSSYRSLYWRDGREDFDSRAPGRVRESLESATWLTFLDGAQVSSDSVDWIEVRDAVMQGDGK